MPRKPRHTTAETQDTNASTQGTKRRAPERQYIPRYRSGGWAILRALETFPPKAAVTKAEIIRVAHQYCDSSFDTPLDNKFYTAWNSVKTLLESGYIYKRGNPPRYCLTGEGAEIAKTIAKASEGTSKAGGNTQNDGPSKKRMRFEEPQSSWRPPESLGLFNPSVPSVPDIPPNVSRALAASNGDLRVLSAGSYTIQLIMDNREIHSQVDRDRLERGIGEGGVDYAVRSLDIGDALWVAKSGLEEYVLDYIVERKRMDDLVRSITDGRFHEQKVSVSYFLLTVVPLNEIRNETYYLYY
jgi:crossover junction endonuclease MUS81